MASIAWLLLRKLQVLDCYLKFCLAPKKNPRANRLRLPLGFSMQSEKVTRSELGLPSCTDGLRKLSCTREVGVDLREEDLRDGLNALH